VVQLDAGVTGANVSYQPGSPCACRYWSALVRKVTPRAASAAANALYRSLRNIHPR
jgi:hypothetical protein